MPNAMDEKPTISEVRDPKMTRARRSRPSSSVPSRWPAVGPRRGALSPMASGSWSGRTLAASAARMISATQPIEIQKPAPSRFATKTGSAGPTAPLTAPGIAAIGAAAATTASVSRGSDGESRTADPGIQERVEQVDEQVDDDETAGHQHGRGRHDQVVARVDGVDREQPQPGHLEDVLDDERAADQRAHVQAADRDQGERRGPERVAQEDPPGGQALGTRHRDEVLLE